MTPLYDAVLEAQQATKRSIKVSLLEQREQIQEDLDCVLDGIDGQVVYNACQVIVDRFKILLDKLEVE